MTYCPDGGGESSLQLSDPAATEAIILTDLQCNTSYTITVVATAGEYRKEGVMLLPPEGVCCIAGGLCLLWSCKKCRSLYRSTEPLSNCAVSYINTSDMGGSLPHTAYHIYYRWTCGTYVDEGRVDTDRLEHTFDGLQKGVNYSFTVTQTGFSGGIECSPLVQCMQEPSQQVNRQINTVPST